MADRAENPLPQRLVVVAGPTASGKTALAAGLARLLGSDIVSVDSRQVYRGLDLGTGKDRHLYGTAAAAVPDPGTSAPQVAVQHHLIDVAEPDEVYSLYRYQQEAYAVLRRWHARRGAWHPLVLCGGTGLYLEAVLRRYAIANVPEDAVMRETLMREGAEVLKARLWALDPEWAARTDTSSKKRVVRALEVALARSRGPVALSEAPDFDFDSLIFVTKYDPNALAESIGRRLRERIEAGLVAEVEGLMAKGVTLERLRQLGLEYREVGEYLAGDRTPHALAAMTQRLQARIEDFAKRQATWFRGMARRGLPVHALQSEDPAAEIRAAVEARWPDVAARFWPSLAARARFTVGVLVDDAGRVLLMRRSDDDDFAPGLWGLPGGHLQPGETPAQALRRELSEEWGTEMRYEVVDSLPPVRDTLYGGVYEVHLHRLRYRGGSVRLNGEHTAWAWVAPEAYAGYRVVPGVDEDLAYLQVWPRSVLHGDRLPPHFIFKISEPNL